MRVPVLISVTSLALVGMIACGGSSASPSSVTSTPITITGNGLTTLTYSNDIRPILAADCFTCHGPTVQQNGFNFSTYAGVYSMLSGDRNQKAGTIYDWVVNSKAAQ